MSSLQHASLVVPGSVSDQGKVAFLNRLYVYNLYVLLAYN